MLSVITDASGRTLSGQADEAFWYSVNHANLFLLESLCSGSAKDARMLKSLSDRRNLCFCYPNAGLPNPLSETGYDETPDQTSDFVKDFAESGFVNIVGGCCGTTPDPINAIQKKLKDIKPRPVSEPAKRATYLAGLEPLSISEKDAISFYMVGERTNVTGSPKFARLIKENQFEKKRFQLLASKLKMARILSTSTLMKV